MTLISTMHEPKPALTDVLDNRPVPKIRIAAFCESPELHRAVEDAALDRRMMRATVEAEMGGWKSALARYKTKTSPDLIILERRVPGDLLLEELGRLAAVCDPDTKVIVIGASNDVGLYRALLDCGISDYLVTPVEGPTLIAAVTRLYEEEKARKLGRTCAFVGAKGGVGSSTVAHNVAAMMAQKSEVDTILADMDLPFGTAGLNFNLDNVQGVADALESGGKLDEMLLDRLLVKCSDRLSMLSAPATLETPYDVSEEDFDALIDLARGSAAQVILDMPHIWSSWARRMLVAADEVVITAAPDLANLRNTKSLVETLRKARPNDAPPRLILNQVGVSKRLEIKTSEFVKAIGLDPVAVIPFEPKVFGKAANNGQMITEIAPRTAAPFAKIARLLLESGGALPKHGGFLSKLSLRKRSA